MCKIYVPFVCNRFLQLLILVFVDRHALFDSLFFERNFHISAHVWLPDLNKCGYCCCRHFGHSMLNTNPEEAMTFPCIWTVLRSWEGPGFVNSRVYMWLHMHVFGCLYVHVCVSVWWPPWIIYWPVKTRKNKLDSFESSKVTFPLSHFSNRPKWNLLTPPIPSVMPKMVVLVIVQFRLL